MDFWDLTKLLFRRWYIAAPMLLLSVGAVYWTSKTVQPDYVATSYVQLLPPTAAQETDEKARDQGPRNPWLELGLGSLSRAAMLTVQDKTVLEQLGDSGLSDNVVVTVDNQQPIMTIEVIGETEAQATATSEEVVKRLAESIVALQSDYGAAKESFITSRRLDRGVNIEESNAKVKRALVAIGGVGVLLSVALTIGLDALLRRNRRRPAVLAEPAAISDTIVLPSRRPVRNGASYVSAGSPTTVDTNGTARSRDEDEDDPARTIKIGMSLPLPRAGKPGFTRSASELTLASELADANGTQLSPSGKNDEVGDDEAPETHGVLRGDELAVLQAEFEAQEDATVVLPISSGNFKSWRSVENRSVENRPAENRSVENGNASH